MTVEMKPTAHKTQAMSIRYQKTWDIQNYSFSQFSLSSANSSRSLWPPAGAWYLPVTWHPTPGSTSNLSSAAGDTEGGGESPLARKLLTISLYVQKYTAEREKMVWCGS